MSPRLPLLTVCCILVHALQLGLVFSRVQASTERPYKYQSYGQVVVRLEELQAKYPEYVEVFTAQERYGLESVDDSCQSLAKEREKLSKGSPHLRHERQTASDLTESRKKESLCEHYFVRLTHKASWKSNPYRPHVFFSGNLHGDEQVGPMALMGFIELLLEEGATGKNAWLSRLLHSRVIVVIPITNPWGYEHRRREENGIDPNRDFPHSVGPTACMKTMLARAVNEVWKDHVFQIAITFHGGMQAIAYEWGAATHTRYNSRSPDETSQSTISSAMSNFAGSLKGKRYPVGRMNQLVYPVAGGMEDWGYSASWDTKRVKPCEPTTYSKYPKSQTQYNSAQNRCFTILVETSDSKKPPENSLGTNKDVLSTHSSGDGHVPRNMRLALLASDVVEPYLVMRQTTESYRPTSGSITSELRKHLPMLRSVPAANVFTQLGEAGEAQSVEFNWEIGGCLNVDRSALTVFQWDPLVTYSVLDSTQSGDTASASVSKHFGMSRKNAAIEPSTIKEVASALSGWSPIVSMAKQREGDSQWPLPSALKSEKQAKPLAGVERLLLYRSEEKGGHCSWGELSKNSDSKPTGTSFRDSIRINDLFERGKPDMEIDVATSMGNFTVRSFFASAIAMVDQAWGVADKADPPGRPPQTHLARVRTDPSFNQTSNRHIVRGKWQFSSDIHPLIIIRRSIVRDRDGNDGRTSASSSRCQQCNERGISPMFLTILILILVIGVGCMRLRQHERKFIDDVNANNGDTTSLQWDGWCCSCIDVFLAWCSPIVRHNRALLRYGGRSTVNTTDEYSEGPSVH
eukprot:gb/GECG01014707.1/.p1 GENE.gb/GECG01014707.1/~~gb/GECG01014707.1/.p1  ORF type:complete len:801 (+),score=53.43 gb/GECG01014707.1/:1-2403(+)